MKETKGARFCGFKTDQSRVFRIISYQVSFHIVTRKDL